MRWFVFLPKKVIVIDLFCKDMNSLEEHRKYIEYLEKGYGAKTINHQSNDKRNDWERFEWSVVFANDGEYFANYVKALRVVTFYGAIILLGVQT